MTQYDYTKTPCAVDRLTQEIQLSAISSTTLDHIDLYGAALSIYFSGSLSVNDKTLLDNIVINHDGTNLNTDYIEISATALTTMNSSSFVTLNQMLSVPLISGTYLVIFSGNFGSNAPLLTTPGLIIGLFNDGTLVPTSQIRQDSTQVGLFGASPVGMSFSCTVQVSNNKVLDVRWKNNGSGNIISCTTRVLTIMRIR